MDVGFDTIGNATLICYDRGPRLVTDPWVLDDAYFGSWTLSHEIPPEQLDAIRNTEFVWISHGHPDHLSPRSMALLRDKKMLLPDHAGARIFNSFREQGLAVQILKDRVWTKLSDRIRVYCIADYNQDAVLLVDINGRLVIDVNDAQQQLCARHVRKIARRYPKSFLLQLVGFGDADMINFWTEDGRQITPRAAGMISGGYRLGADIARNLDLFGARFFVPFSSMHQYQRADSVWANAYVTKLSDYPCGFESKSSEILPAFARYDCERDQLEPINPPEREIKIRDPKEFADDWSQPLDSADVVKIERYFKAIEHLAGFLDFIRVRVAGADHVIELAKSKFSRGITFEAPRSSLMIAVEEEVFDDMLIGNFMRTTLHGEFQHARTRPDLALYPHFTPYVGKYADNGKARTQQELDAYFEEYRRRAPLEHFLNRLEGRSIDVFRNFIASDSSVFKLAKSAYFLAKQI